MIKKTDLSKTLVNEKLTFIKDAQLSLFLHESQAFLAINRRFYYFCVVEAKFGLPSFGNMSIGSINSWLAMMAKCR